MLDKVEAVAPTIDEVRALSRELEEWVVRTPVTRCRNLEARLESGAEIFGKLEFLQQTGTFKPRGALSNILNTDKDQLAAGVTAVSAGNHAIATAFAARCAGVSAKVVMISSASPVRIEACRQYGAEVVLADDVYQAFALVEEIRDKEGRCYIHPFEGRNVTAGTATIGLELCEQIVDFDSVIVPIGGGGLCSGIASAVKQLKPDCEVIGVEPEGADSMRRSFASGEPEKLETVNTIADSLGAPFALPYSFQVCRQYVDELVTVSDAEISAAMALLFRDMKIAVEPACAASTAALAGPLQGRFDGKKVVLIFCGSNIDWNTFQVHAGTL
ncbi:MAG: threonine/serine dehydratase [Woeseiaceae bacterium]